MSVEGIQRGHMNLHARNVAIQAGIPTDLVNQAVFFMKTRNKINQKTALQYLDSHKLFKSKQDQSTTQTIELSSLYVEIHEQFLPEPLVLTILMETKLTPYHLSIEKDSKASSHLPSQNISKVLFAGKDHKGYDWMVKFLALMHQITFMPKREQNRELVMT